MLHLIFLLSALTQAPDPAAQARETVERIAARSDGFAAEFEQAVRSGMDGDRQAASRARHRGREFQQSAKKLQSVFAAKKEKNDPAVRDQVARTIAAGSDINRVILRNRFTPELRHQWEAIRSDLNALAQIYSLSPF